MSRVEMFVVFCRESRIKPQVGSYNQKMLYPSAGTRRLSVDCA